MPTNFRTAVMKINGQWFCQGLQALQAADRKRIRVTQTRRITGSVHLDDCLKSQYPEDPRWDYAIGYIPAGGNRETIYWIEVHPAHDGAIKEVIQKRQWLIRWLEEQGRPLNSFPGLFIWISSSGTGWNARSPQSKRLATEGIRYCGAVVDLEKVR